MEVFVPYKVKIGTRLENLVDGGTSSIIFDEKFLDEYLSKNIGKEVEVSVRNLALMNHMDPNCKYRDGLMSANRQSIGTIAFVGKLGVTIDTTEKIAEAIKKDGIQTAILIYYNSIEPDKIIKVKISLYWQDKDKIVLL